MTPKPKPKQSSPSLPLHTAAGANFINWLTVLWKNGGLDWPYWWRGTKVTLSSFSMLPLAWIEKLMYQTKIEQISIAHPPIFIIGHWRSGTTYFHHLMGQDPNLGFPSLFQVIYPEVFLIAGKPLYFFTQLFLPKYRPMDHVRLYANYPEEEEYAIANLCPYSYFHGLHFPKQGNMRKHFNQYVLFAELSPRTKQEWKKIYLKLIKKFTLAAQGKQLVLKNPANTGRIDVLLELFPKAKFIYLEREPYAIYSSTKKLYSSGLSVFKFQNVDERDIDDNILIFYRQLRERYLELKNKIPSQNLFELKFENFLGNEISILEQIYKQFDLKDFAVAKPKFEAHIQQNANYSQNEKPIDEETRQKIYRHWQSIIEQY
jgi:hypothetical protein